MTVDFVAYHSKTHAEHQQQQDALRPQGYRITSLSVYGAPADPRYAAVWVKRPGPEWQTVHGVSGTQYQTWFGQMAAKGLQPRIVTATGGRQDAVFAAVMEAGPGPTHPSRVHLRLGTPEEHGTFAYWCDWAARNRHTLRWAAVYGDAADPVYAGIWAPDTSEVAWEAGGANQSQAEHDARFAVQVRHWARLAFHTKSGSGRWLSAYRDDSVGAGWAPIELTAAGLDQHIAAKKANGMYPVLVQGAGTGTAARFATIFGTREEPKPRVWTVTGQAVPSLRAFDEVTKRFMQTYGIRAGGVAVAKDGRLVYARGFTWAPDDYPVTQPTTGFRIGSCSKSMTAILVMRLVADGVLSLDDPVQQHLQLTPPPNKAVGHDAWDAVLVRHLLTHTSGVTPNFAFEDPDIVAAWPGSSLPMMDKRKIAGYQLTKPKEFDPGTQSMYANFGTFLLTMLVEKFGKATYADVLASRLLAPLGLTRPGVATSVVEGRKATDARFHDGELRLVPSVMSAARPLVRSGYGNVNLEVGAGVGGLVFSGADMCRVLASFDLGDANPVMDAATRDLMWTDPNSPRRNSSVCGWWESVRPGGVRELSHGGALTESQAVILHRTDGVSLSAAFNTGPRMPGPVWAHTIENVHAWPTHDLFPSVGLPSF